MGGRERGVGGKGLSMTNGGELHMMATSLSRVSGNPKIERRRQVKSYLVEPVKM